jgi:DNA-binding response OmpR family regulator
MRILIIEDQEKLARSLKKGLEHYGYAVDMIHDGAEGMRRLEFDHKDYDLLILDRMLPGMDGMDICRTLREKGSTLPVLMLTAKDALDDKIEGLNIGADDYLVKPFDFPELAARVQALLRRPTEKFVSEIEVRGIVLNPVTRIVTRNGKEIALTAKEFSILEQFMRHPNEALTRERILGPAWDFAYDGLSNVIDVHVKNLRKKLQQKIETLFETVHGVGYRLKA